MERALSRVVMLAALAVAAPELRAEEKDSLREQALKLNEITGADPQRGELYSMLKDEAGSKKLIEAAHKMIKERPVPFHGNAAFLLGEAAYAFKQYDASKDFYKIASDDAFRLQSPSRIVRVYNGQIDLCIAAKKYDQAITTCKEFLELDPGETGSPIASEKPFIMQRQIQATAKLGKIDEALQMTDELIATGETLGWLKLKAEVYREGERFEEAVKIYTKALKYLDDNKDFSAKDHARYVRILRYALCGVLVDLEQIDKASEQFKLLLKADPDNATFNNDLGFVWADHDMKLDEAEQLIRKALELDRKARKKLLKDGLIDEAAANKENSAYIDSLGWVLFKKKQYKEAKKVMEPVLNDEEAQHIEILDHIADIDMALGEKAEAVKIWEKALKLDTDTKRDRERRKKIEEKLKEAQEKLK